MQQTKPDKRSEELLEEIRAILARSVELQQKAVEQDRERTTATDNLPAYAEMEAGLAKQRTGYSQERTSLVRAQTRFTTRSTELAEIRTDLALERGRLAMERTELAVLRTELARVRNNLAMQRNEMADTRTRLAQFRNTLAQQRNEMSEERTRLAETRTQLSTLNTTYAKTRVELARSRTELAIIRTGAALVSFAIGLVAVGRFFPISDLWWNVFLVGMGLSGAIALGIGLTYYWRTWVEVRYLDRTNNRQESQMPFLSGLVRARSENAGNGFHLFRRK